MCKYTAGLRRTYSLSVQTGQQPVLFRILFCRKRGMDTVLDTLRGIQRQSTKSLTECRLILSNVPARPDGKDLKKLKKLTCLIKY